MEAGKSLKDRRISLSLTQEQVARRAGVDVNTVARLEKGLLTRPTFEAVVAIGMVLGYSPDQLAHLYRLYTPVLQREEAVEELLALLRELPAGKRGLLIDYIKLVIATEIAKEQEQHG